MPIKPDMCDCHNQYDSMCDYYTGFLAGKRELAEKLLKKGHGGGNWRRLIHQMADL